MPIIITMAWGEQIRLPGTWNDALNAVSRLGTLEIKNEDGHKTTLIKSHIGKVDEWTDTKWDELVAEHKKREAEQKKAQIRAQAQAQVNAWNAKPWLKRVFRKCPITLPADLAEKKA